MCKKKPVFLKYPMLLFCVINWFFPFAGAQSNLQKVVEKLTPNVVTVKVSVENSTISEGFGFIVAESLDQFFIVTAGHVIHTGQFQQNGTGKISLQFYSQYSLEAATELAWLESEDLSLLSCPKPKVVNWNPRFANFAPVTFDRVTSIGKNQKWNVSGIGNINLFENPWIYFTMGALEPGCSGAPLITEKGIVGMIVTDQNTSSRALNLSKIRELIGSRIANSGWLPYQDEEAYFTKLFEKNMVPVEGGSFKMGCTSEQGPDCASNEISPRIPVNLNNFFIGKYEVTQDEWYSVMKADPPNLDYKNCGNCPVSNVSLQEVQIFISKLNALTGKRYRLPSEAEWEFAARGGKHTKGYKYSGSNSLDVVAWYDKNSRGIAHPVGESSPNELGLYDMSGNVYEWCEDWYSSNLNNSPANYEFRVLRGGGYSQTAKECRVSHRFFNTPNNSNGTIGFRLAHDGEN